MLAKGHPLGQYCNRILIILTGKSSSCVLRTNRIQHQSLENILFSQLPYQQ